MRTGRNSAACKRPMAASLDHWDMRTGRNLPFCSYHLQKSLDHWDMRTGRNQYKRTMNISAKSRSLGYAHWPELHFH